MAALTAPHSYLGCASPRSWLSGCSPMVPLRSLLPFVCTSTTSISPPRLDARGGIRGFHSVPHLGAAE
eukprot:1530808-Rhodomonas_salina.1